MMPTITTQYFEVCPFSLLSSRVLLDPSQYIVIHNSSEADSKNALQCQFEDALDQGYTLVVVEPAGLGSECIRWIRVGNFLHKASVLCALGALSVTPFIRPQIALFVTYPIGCFGVFCAVLYRYSWESDPCCKYQVDYRGRELRRIPSHVIHTPSPVVLVRKNDKFRKILHNTLSVVVAGYLFTVLYSRFNYWPWTTGTLHPQSTFSMTIQVEPPSSNWRHAIVWSLYCVI